MKTGCFAFKYRSALGASTVGEFAPVLFIVFTVFLVPLIVNLTGLATGAATLFLETNEAATSASAQQDFSGSLTAIYDTANNFAASGFSKYAEIKPLGGFSGCGVDLYVRTTNVGGKTTIAPANTALTLPINLTDNVYEFVTETHCSVGPIMDMGKISLFANVPGLGTPASLRMKAVRMVEHPMGMTSASAAASSDAAPAPFNRQLTSTAGNFGADYNYPGWHDTGIFSQIEQAGQTVVSVSVVSINATQPWQASGVSVQPGQTAWIDTNAVGLWSTDTYGPTFDANGLTGSGGAIYDVDSAAPNSALIGYCGYSPPPVVYENGGTTDPNMFYVGDTLTNYVLNPAGGALSFMMNDNCPVDNSGSQLVRIIIAQ